MKKAAWPLLAAVLLFMLLGALLYGRPLLLQVVPGSPDSVTPLALSKALDALRIRTGLYPLWAPWTFSGMPTVEAFSYLSGLYLPNLLFDYLHLEGVHTQWLHLVFAGMGGFALARRLGLKDIPAFFTGTAIMFNPFMTAMFAYGHGSQLMTAAWMPWALWAALGLAERARVLDAGFLALVLGLQLQRAHVQIAYYTWMLVIPFILVVVLAGKADSRKSFLVGGLTAVALALGLAIAMQIYYPALEYLPSSARSGAGNPADAYRYATLWSLHPSELLTFVLPGAFGFGGPSYWGYMPFTDFPHYAGLVVLVFAAVGIVSGRKSPKPLFFAASALLFLLLSFGNHFSFVYDLFYQFAPMFRSFRVPSMALIAVSLSLSVLAGYGLQAFLDLKPEAGASPALRWGALAVALAALLFLSFETPLEQLLRAAFPPVQVESPDLAALVNNNRWNLWKTSAFMFVVLGGAVAGIAWLASRKIAGPRLAAVLLVVLSVADLFLIDHQILFPDDRSLRTPPLVDRVVLDRALSGDGVTRFIAAQPGLFRIYPVGPLFTENKFSIAGIESVGGYHAAKLGVYQNVLARTGNLANIGLLQLLNVRYLVSPVPIDNPECTGVATGVIRLASGDTPVAIYELAGAKPRAWFASEVTATADDASALASVMAGEGEPDQAWSSDLPWQGTRRFAGGTILSLNRKPESITMTVRADGDAFLVLSEVYYPQRWKLTVDGHEQRFVKVDGLVRGVALGGGTHELRFTYDRSRFETGRKISLAGTGATLFLIAGGVFAVAAAGRRSSTNVPKKQ